MMMRLIVWLLILFPCVAFSQAMKEDYGIYSQYLKVFQASKKVDKIYFVVNETTANNQNNYLIDINSIVNDLRGNIKRDINARSGVYSTFKDFAITLTKDTLWIPLIAELNKKMKQGFKIENNFSSDLHTIVISDTTAKKYFKHSKAGKQIERKWARFHKQYPMPSVLIELSEIANDGQRVAFVAMATWYSFTKKIMNGNICTVRHYGITKTLPATFPILLSIII